MKKLIIVCICFLSVSFFSFSRDFKGVVLDIKQRPVSFVSIYLKNSPQIGTVTDKNGRFLLSVADSDNDDMLVFSFIGYEVVMYSVANLNSSKELRVTLKDQPILLDAVVVVAKGSKRQQRSNMKILLANIHAQMAKDFSVETRKYRLVSDISVYNEGQVVAFDELIGHMLELPIKSSNKKNDSIQVQVDMSKYYVNADIESGIKNFDSNLFKRKERKQFEKIDWENSAMAHQFLWMFDMKKTFDDIYKEVGNWSVTERDAESQLLTYVKTFNLLGIVKSTMTLSMTIDKNLSVKQLSQNMTVFANIPFGYKLSEGQLSLLNLMVMEEDFEKYRVKTLEGAVQRNVIFRRQGNQIVISEKNWVSKMKASDKNNRLITFNQKASVQVLSVETNQVKPYTQQELNRRGKRVVVSISEVK